MELSGSRTEANLQTAFAGESMARSKYTIFAQRARSDGYEQIAGIFDETADNEFEHATQWFKFLHGGETPMTPANLQAAIDGENYEWTQMYKEFEQVARQEGFLDIAHFFKEIGEVEEEHEKRYAAFLANVDNGRVFVRDGEVYWQCRNCGYIHKGKEAPKVCPACSFPQSYYQIKPDNY